MCTSLAAGASLEIENFLTQHDRYISILARNNIYKMKNSNISTSLEMEIDELVQRVRIKLWKILLRQNITNPRAYIAKIVYHETISMLRQQRYIGSLTFDEEGEPCHGQTLIEMSEGMADPAYEVEQQEASHYYLSRVAQAVARLAPHQRRAMLCVLKDRLDDFASFVAAYDTQDLDASSAAWPSRKDELLRLKASISHARKNIRSFILFTDQEEVGGGDWRTQSLCKE
jgi:DNA-directed RNA polymerase specialized sigma24 family protein